MKPGACHRLGPSWWPALTLILLSGCLQGERKDDGLPPLPQIPIEPAKLYTLMSPDVVEVRLAYTPGESVQTVTVNAEGDIDLGRFGKMRIEGMTVSEAQQTIAARAGVSSNYVDVRVSGYKSRTVLLFGEVIGGARMVSYQGPETVVDLLRRTEVVTADASWNEIHLLRSHLANGSPPEVLRIDMNAILDRGDERTNVRVQPLDEIYIGEKPSAHFRRSIPGFLRPMYDTIVEMLPNRHGDK